MQPDRASWTAELVAAMRADHVVHDRPLILDDPFALPLCSPELRASIESGGFQRANAKNGMRPTQGHLVARARYADDVLREAGSRGVRQALVLAAGFDTTALRCDPRVHVYEVDHPATQQLKRARVEALAPPPASARAPLEYASIDFERTPLAEALAATSYDSSRPAFVSWNGVTMYLDRATAREALRGIRSCLAPGCELVFDYNLPVDGLTGRDREVADQKRSITASHGEPKRGTWHPEALFAALSELGFERVVDLDAAALTRRYCAGRSDGLVTSPDSRIAHYRAA